MEVDHEGDDGLPRPKYGGTPRPPVSLRSASPETRGRRRDSSERGNKGTYAEVATDPPPARDRERDNKLWSNFQPRWGPTPEVKGPPLSRAETARRRGKTEMPTAKKSFARNSVGPSCRYDQEREERALPKVSLVAAASAGPAEEGRASSSRRRNG